MKSNLNSIESSATSRKITELSGDELHDYMVSEHSRFIDTKWYFASHLPGAPKASSSLNWSMLLSDGSQLTDARHANRMHWAKILLLTLLVLPANQRVRSYTSLGNIQVSFNYLLSWMSENGYHFPTELTPHAVQCYIDYVVPVMAARCSDGELTRHTFARGLFIISQLWHQRNSLKQMGIESMASHPFNGKTSEKIASELTAKASNLIPPLPDEVALPLLNKAAWFLGAPADDVMRLVDVFSDPLAGTTMVAKSKFRRDFKYTAGVKRGARHRRAQSFLNNFSFGVLKGRILPWHDPILSRDAKVKNDSENKIPDNYSGKRRAAELILAVRDSAAIILQAMTGMRASELLSIRSGIDESSNLPSGVRVEQSLSGLYEWFLVRSSTSKTEEGSPRDVDWVLGMRPLGSTEIPLAVRALYILNDLQIPWRSRATTDYLFLSISHGKGLIRTDSSAGTMSVKKLNWNMQRFIMRWVDLSSLPDRSAYRSTEDDLVLWRETRGEIFRTHMLRKTWAQYTLACDSRLLPAIQMQFHHLSLAMTEGSYIGSNPILLEELNSVSVQKRNLLLFEAVVGNSQLAGRMGEQLSLAAAELRTEVKSLPLSRRWIHIAAWADRNDLRMFFSAHATCCPSRSSEMRCHDISQTPIWIRQAPNTSTRSPSLCAGCACAIMDKSHEKFWSDRYIASNHSLAAADTIHISNNSFREVRFRAEQAKGILKKFGTDIAALDQIISSMSEELCQR